MVLTKVVVRVSGPVAVAALALSVGCTQAAHDVGCGEFLEMSGTEKDKVVASFLDDHPIGRLTFGEDESQQQSLASMSLNAYCMQNPDTNIDNLEPDLIPGL